MKKLLLFLFLSILVTQYLSNFSPVLAATTVTLQTFDPQISPNQTATVIIDITSTDETLGTDLVLTYDPTILKPTAITPGTVYPNYSDTDLSENSGTLYISAVSDLTQGTTPNGQFASVTFTALKPGYSDMGIAFDPEDSSLSGVIPFDGSDENLLTPPDGTFPIFVKQPNLFVRLWNTIVSFFSFLLPR